MSGSSTAADSYQGTISAFSDAALDSSLWSSALETLSRESGSFGAILIPAEGRLPIMPRSDSLEHVHRAYVEDGWFERDQRYQSMPALLKRSVATEFDFTTSEQMNRHPYWQEFLAPFGLRWWAGVAVKFGDDLWIASIQRTVEQGPFSETELRGLQALSGHLSSAGSLANALDFARLEAATRAFQSSNRAVLFLNHRARVVALNDAANDLLGQDLQIKNGEIVSYSRDATAEFARAVNSLLQPDLSWKKPSVVVLPRRKGRPLLAMLTRPSQGMFDAVGKCRCIISLVDLNTTGQVENDLLKSALGLTNAEVRLANQLSEGMSVNETASALGISYETARGHLKSIYDKLGLSGRAELSKLVSKIRERVILADQ